MLISAEKKFLFVHVQKTAGTSMTLLLKEHIPDLVPYLGTHDHALWAKNRADFIWDDYFKVAFVRNPWDRLVSWYSMIAQNSSQLNPPGQSLNALWKYVLSNASTFEEFIIRCTDTIDDRDGKKSFLFNQLDYVANESGEIIVDYVGRFESLEEDAQAVFDKLGLSGIAMPYHNPSKRSHYRDYYNEKTKLLVGERYARDIKFFGYEF